MSTAGLGQDTTVFDFSGISELGLQIDQLNEQRAQKRSAKFTAGNKDIIDGVSKAGIRDVDSPYINEKYNAWMSKASEAMRTEDPALAQEARNMRTELSDLIATSQAYEKNDMVQKNKIANSDDPDFFTQEITQHRQATAMNADNQGAVGDAGMYFFVPKQDFVEGTMYDAAVKSANVVTANATRTVSSSDPTKSFSSTKTNRAMAEQLAGEQFDEVYINNPLGQKLAIEQYYQKKFDTDRFTTSQTAQMNKDVEESRALNEKYGGDIEALRNDPALKNDPFALKNAEAKFNLMKDIHDKSKESFVETVMANVKFADNVSTTEKAPSGGESGSDFGQNFGQSAKAIFPNYYEKGTVNMTAAPDFEKGASFGYSSTKGGSLKSIGTGKDKIFYEGISVTLDLQGNPKYYINTLVPAAGELEQLIKAQQEGKSGAELLDLIEFEMKPQPLGSYQGDIPRGELSAMKKVAKEAADAQLESILDAMEGEE